MCCIMESIGYTHKTKSVLVIIINIEHLLLPVMLDHIHVIHSLNYQMDNLFMDYCNLNTG